MLPIKPFVIALFIAPAFILSCRTSKPAASVSPRQVERLLIASESLQRFKADFYLCKELQDSGMLYYAQVKINSNDWTILEGLYFQTDKMRYGLANSLPPPSADDGSGRERLFTIILDNEALNDLASTRFFQIKLFEKGKASSPVPNGTAADINGFYRQLGGGADRG